LSVGFGRVINRNYYSDTKQRSIGRRFLTGLLNAGSPVVIHIAHSADGMKNLSQRSVKIRTPLSPSALPLQEAREGETQMLRVPSLIFAAMMDC
jgi:hypothetical protein